MVNMNNIPKHKSGFTLIELLVVMTIIALLLSIVAPRYFGSVSKAEEAVLKEDLMLMRDALDKFRADTGQYPDLLEDLVSKKYLRKIPEDPVTHDNTTWIVVPPGSAEKGAVFDVKSGAPGNSRDGTPYAEW
jgi:general secretion pathway protein G